MTEPREPQSVFIVSTGRTGTLFLSKYFQSAFPGCESVHEPNMYILRILSHMAASEFLNRFSRRIAKFILKRRNTYISRQNAGFYLESNSVFVDIIAQIYNKPKFVHIIRDPRDFVRSGINWNTFRGLKGLFNRFFPYWTHRSVQKTWKKYSKIETLSHVWNIRNRQIEQRLSGIAPEQILRLKFEDIFLSEHHEGLKKLQSFIGLGETIKSEILEKIEKNASTSNLFPAWQEWDTEQCRKLYGICHELMEKYGYGEEQVWLETFKYNMEKQ